MTLPRRTLLSAFALGAALAPQWARAQAAWPDKPLRIVVPATAGSSLDGLARVYAEHLQRALKQTVVVENKPGANQTIGIGAVKSAPADGYTLLLTSTELVRVPQLYPHIRYDPFAEFTPLWQVAATSTFLAVPTSLGVSTLAEFIALAKKTNPPLTVGSPGQGSGAHFYTELLSQSQGAPLTHVAYRGEVPLLPDLLSGRISAGWISGNLVTQYVQEGKVKVLGVGSMKRRVASMPQVPTFAEQGVPDLDIEGFIGLYVLSQTPQPIVERLETELRRIGAQDDVRRVLSTYGMEPGTTTTRAQFEAVMRGTYDGWARAIRKANIKLE